MATIEQLAASISDLRRLQKRSRLLPQFVVARRLCVSKQRLSALILGGQILSESLDGFPLVDVSSALSYAKSRYLRISQGKKTK